MNVPPNSPGSPRACQNSMMGSSFDFGGLTVWSEDADASISLKGGGCGVLAMCDMPVSLVGVGMIPVAEVLLESGEDDWDWEEVVVGWGEVVAMDDWDLVRALDSCGLVGALVGWDLVGLMDDWDLVGSLDGWGLEGSLVDCGLVGSSVGWGLVGSSVADWVFDALLDAGKGAGAPRQPVRRRDSDTESSDRSRSVFTLLSSKPLQCYARRSYIGTKELVQSFGECYGHQLRLWA